VELYEPDERVTDLPSGTLVCESAGVDGALSRRKDGFESHADYDPAVIVNGYFFIGKHNTVCAKSLEHYASAPGMGIQVCEAC
jgi:hypothetical protein